MAFFATARDVDECIGGIFRLAAADQIVGPRLASAGTSLRIVVRDPDCELTVELSDPVAVTFGAGSKATDVTLTITADRLHTYWSGDYSLLDGLARGEVGASGRISRVLKVLPATRLMIPRYLELVARRSQPAPVPTQRTQSSELRTPQLVLGVTDESVR
ncbi:MAG: hypothetical protein JWP74_3187 [Marmoricola sp.]|nr:hypothetical protein [Marmoricola sp.]